MTILGIWDGHDAGAALLADGCVVAAVNEERLTRRKLEVRFPRASLEICLSIGGLRPSDVHTVACSTFDLAKTLARLFPATKERYYAIRRRKAQPGRLAALQKGFKYWLTELPGNRLTCELSKAQLKRQLDPLGLGHVKLVVLDHHHCHVLAAAHASGFASCTVLSIDGVGDGLSSTVNAFRDGTVERIAASNAKDSLGILFEHVTNLLNMRELEDEGKVMALADFAAPVPDEKNPIMKLLGANGLRTTVQIPGHRLRAAIQEILWRFPNEQVAYMAQRSVEVAMTALAREAVRVTGLPRIALAGGVVSNIKANRAIRMLPEVEDVFVFPHMGDGGLAFGAAVTAAQQTGERVPRALDSLALGPEYDASAIASALAAASLDGRTTNHLAAEVAAMIGQGEIVLWFQGRMEFGPRALGNRSIFARPDRPAIRDRLNLILKQRVWYQPFCPTILESDARRVFSDWKGRPNRHMTMGYLVRPEYRDRLAGVTGIDGSCRPQIVPDEPATLLSQLLTEVRQHIGIGSILNTSFNIHGEPIVCTPAEAIDVYQRSGADALAIGPYLIRRRA